LGASRDELDNAFGGDTTPKQESRPEGRLS